MRFMLIVYLEEEVEARKSEAERNAMFARCIAHSDGWRSRGLMKDGAALRPTSMSTTVRVRNGATILTDGPFAETKEQLGGYYIVDCATEEEALRLAEEASEIHGDSSGVIELRPIMDFTAA